MELCMNFFQPLVTSSLLGPEFVFHHIGCSKNLFKSDTLCNIL
jgi:hypothetical protein